MNVINWFTSHPVYMSAATLFVYHAFSAAIGNLQMPDATSGKFYRWFFGFSNQLAANYSRASASKDLPARDSNQAKIPVVGEPPKV